jgi:hypothetical protein
MIKISSINTFSLNTSWYLEINIVFPIEHFRILCHVVIWLVVHKGLQHWIFVENTVYISCNLRIKYLYIYLIFFLCQIFIRKTFHLSLVSYDCGLRYWSFFDLDGDSQVLILQSIHVRISLWTMLLGWLRTRQIWVVRMYHDRINFNGLI